MVSLVGADRGWPVAQDHLSTGRWHRDDYLVITRLTVTKSSSMVANVLVVSTEGMLRRDPTDADLERLLSSMSAQEKAGALLVARTTVGHDGSLWRSPADGPFGFLPVDELLARHITNVTVMSPAPPAHLLRWTEQLRQLFAKEKLPITVHSDPLHGWSTNPATSMPPEGFCRLPEPLGLAATRDPELVEKCGRLIGEELKAAGVDVTLSPMADLATEPRWPRVSGTFGEDASLVVRMVRAYLKGVQGAGVGCVVKHFPGGGAEKDGHDAHFEQGRHTVYPGGGFGIHLGVFEQVLSEKVWGVMPGYPAPLHKGLEPVGFAFNKTVVTDLLRRELGFDGLVMSDFNIVTGMRVAALGVELPVRAWGALDLTPVERVARLFDAGVDQLGGEDDPALILTALDRGLVSEERIDQSVMRVLKAKRELGLLALRHPAPSAGRSAADRAIEFAEHERIAVDAAVTSLVALRGKPLRFTGGIRVHLEGIAPEAIDDQCTIVDDPAQADLALISVPAPFEPESAGPFGAHFHGGSLDFPDGTIARISTVARNVPTVVNVVLDRPACLTPLVGLPCALMVSFGVDDRTLFRAMTGQLPVTGRLPCDIPRSTRAVAASREDLPFDTEDPVFHCGEGKDWFPSDTVPVICPS